MIALCLQIESNSGGFHRLVLLLNLLGEDADSSEGVLHLLESGQHGLPIAGQIGVVGGDELVDGGAAQAGIEDSLRNRRTDGPDAAGPVEKVLPGRAFKAAEAERVRLG